MSRIGPREPVALGLRGTRSLADVLWLANTRHGPGGHWFARPGPGDPGHDHLASGDGARYLADHHVDVPDAAPSARDMEALAAIATMVRGLASGGGWTPTVSERLERARYGLTTDGTVRAHGTGWAAWIDDVFLPLGELVRLARTGRVRECANPACRLVFLDATRAGTRRWCDDAGCGNRSRVRRFRGRTAASSPG